MTKYVFGSHDSETLYLEDAGEITTDSKYADIKFQINRLDETVELGIQDQYFDADDLEELIGFLKALKKEISK